MQRCICHVLRRHGLFTNATSACTIACISKFISLRKKRAKTAANIGDATSGPHMVTSMILLHVQRIIDVVEAVRSIDNVAIATPVNRINSAVCVSEARDGKF